eukprot:sb/3461234/
MLHVIQHNLRKSSVAAAEIRLTLENQGDTIALVTEPPLRKDKINVISFGKQRVFPSSSKFRVRAAIITNPASGFREISQFCSGDMAVIKKDKLVICSLYWASNEPLPGAMEDLAVWCKNEGLYLIIGGDFNCHDYRWGARSDKRGETLVELMEKTKLKLMNTPGKITWAARGLSSTIDLTLASHHKTIQDWTVTDTQAGSDHFKLTFNFKPPGKEPQKKVKKCIIKVDYTKMKALINKDRPRLLENTQSSNLAQLNQKERRITGSVRRALEGSRQKIWLTENKESWMDHQGRQDRNAWTEADKLTRKSADLNSPETQQNLEEDCRTKLNTWRSSIERQKKKGFQAHCSALGMKGTSGMIKTTTNKQKKRGIPSVSRNGIPIADEKEALEFTAKTLLGGNVADQDSLPSSSSPQISLLQMIERARLAEEAISEEKIEKALNSIKNKRSAPGPDGILYKTLLEIWPAIKGSVTSLFKDCIRLGAVPSAWCCTRGFLLPKPGKDTTEPKSYRTISLAQTQFKLLERVLFNYLEPILQNKWHPLQFGFRAGKGVDPALSRLLEEIEKPVSERKIVLGIFVDIRGAFDRVRKTSLTDALSKHSCPEAIVQLYQDFLARRSITVESGKHSVSLNELPGGAQGTIGMPPKWNCVTTELLHQLNEKVHAQAVADDFAATVPGTSIDNLLYRGQWVLDTISTWASSHHLELNPEKTKFVLFTHKRIPPTGRTLTYKGHQITEAITYKYLGVTLDNRLSWIPHFEEVIEKARRVEGAALGISGDDWGSSMNMRQWIWDAIVLPKITHGAQITAPAVLKRGRVQNLLQGLDYQASKRTIRCGDKAPKYLAQTLAGLKPSRVAILERATITQAKSGNDKPEIRKAKTFLGHQTALSSRVEAATESCTVDYTPTTYHRIENIYTATEELVPLTGPGFHIYTDGSKTKSGTGAGWVIFKDGTQMTQGKITLHPNQSIGQAETQALTSAIEMVIQHELYNESGATFYTDSNQTLQKLKSGKTTEITIKTLANSIIRLREKTSVSLSWCKAHVGTPGNEIADALAKEAATSTLNTAPHLIPLSQVKKNAKVQASRDTIETCKGLKNKLKSTNSLMCYVENMRNYYEDRVPTATSRRTSQFIANRGQLRKFNNKIGKATSPTCRFCMLEPEDNNHVLCTCPAIRTERAEALGDNYLHPSAISSTKNKSLDKFLLQTLYREE